jgi:hypothetical protein
MDKSDLIESLKIGNLTSISIQTADGKAIMQSSIFPTLLIASRLDVHFVNPVPVSFRLASR